MNKSRRLDNCTVFSTIRPKVMIQWRGNRLFLLSEGHAEGATSDPGTAG
jgi:hypothetical protein